MFTTVKFNDNKNIFNIKIFERKNKFERIILSANRGQRIYKMKYKFIVKKYASFTNAFSKSNRNPVFFFSCELQIDYLIDI